MAGGWAAKQGAQGWNWNTQGPLMQGRHLKTPRESSAISQHLRKGRNQSTRKDLFRVMDLIELFLLEVSGGRSEGEREHLRGAGGRGAPCPEEVIVTQILFSLLHVFLIIKVNEFLVDILEKTKKYISRRKLK